MECVRTVKFESNIINLQSIWHESQSSIAVLTADGVITVSSDQIEKKIICASADISSCKSSNYTQRSDSLYPKSY